MTDEVEPVVRATVYFAKAVTAYADRDWFSMLLAMARCKVWIEVAQKEVNVPGTDIGNEGVKL